MKLNLLLYFLRTELIKHISLIHLLPFLFLLTNCVKQDRQCKNFYIGKFYSEIVIEDKVFKSSFSRNSANIQIEEFEGIIDSSRVRWVNDCEMILSSINPKNINAKKNVLIKILQTTDSSYTYEYSYVGENKKLKAEAFRIK
tara:strand:- start:218 stop:643 length:426 start_codon:yes stop_codon:yes gene_type:complete